MVSGWVSWRILGRVQDVGSVWSKASELAICKHAVHMLDEKGGIDGHSERCNVVEAPLECSKKSGKEGAVAKAIEDDGKMQS